MGTGARRAARIDEVTAGRWADIVRYVRAPSQGMAWHVAVLAVLTLLCWAAHRRARRGAADGTRSSGTVVLDRPYSAALVIAVLFAISPFLWMAATVRILFVIVALFPVIRVAEPSADPRLIRWFYAVWLLFIADRFRESLDGDLAVEHLLVALEALAGVVMLVRSLRVGNLRRAAGEETETGRLAALRNGATLIMLVFAGALGAGVIGYMHMARLVVSGVIASVGLALILYAAVRVLTDVATVVMRVWPLGALRMVREHGDLLAHRTHLVLVLAAFWAWGVRTLDHVGLLLPTLTLVGTVLGANLGRGSIQVSVGNLLEFALTLWLAYLASAFIRFVLSEDVYPRTRLTRGLTYAISSLLNYAIIALGFVLGLG